MCMSTVTWKAKSLSNARSVTKWQKGYKVFNLYPPGSWNNETDHDVIKFPHYNLNNTREVELNKVLKAESTTHTEEWNDIEHKYVPSKKTTPRIVRIDNINGGDYTAGFHIFPAKMAARLFFRQDSVKRIFEVEYRKVIAEGTHEIETTYPADCVIAQEMKVLRQLTKEEVTELEKYKEVMEEIARKSSKRKKTLKIRS